jgi:hypothetical protein
MIGTYTAAAVVVAGLLVGATNASAAEIQVCEHKNYGGRCITLKHGVNDLNDWGMSNTISSFRIRSGTWRLCTQDNLQGACQDFSRSVSDLSGGRLQDQVSSLRPVREGSNAGGTAIVVYSAPEFRGRSLVFSHDEADLRRVGLNDRIASVRVLGGRWQICSDIDYVGCRSVTGDIPDLGAIGWGSRISSIREGDRSWNQGGGYPSGGYPGGGYQNQGPTLTLFDAQNFRGRSYSTQDEVRNLADAGFNDMAVSIRVDGGRWQVCTDSDFRGQCLTLDRNDGQLAPIFARQISSIRRLSGGGGYQGGGYPGGGYQNQTPTLTMFDDQNFRGRSYAAQREVRNLADVGFNDMAVSIRVDGGRWQVCTDKNFQGQCMVIDRNTSQLATNFLRQISSIRPR